MKYKDTAGQTRFEFKNIISTKYKKCPPPPIKDNVVCSVSIAPKFRCPF